MGRYLRSLFTSGNTLFIIYILRFFRMVNRNEHGPPPVLTPWPVNMGGSIEPSTAEPLEATLSWAQEERLYVIKATYTQGDAIEGAH